MDKIDALQKMINEANNIVFFGGAGVSTASGIKDFRSKDGLYSLKTKYPAEYMLSSEMFFKHTSEFYDYYKENLNCLDVKPNIVHKYLKELEECGKLKAIITQNIDGLHSKAGSKNVLELHGTVFKNHCLKCGKEFSAEYVFNAKGIPLCDECQGIIKPDVVLYGESLPDSFIQAQEFILKADMLIVAGTSLTVQPASSLVNLFRGKFLVMINRTKTPSDATFDLVINDSLKDVFEKLKATF